MSQLYLPSLEPSPSSSESFSDEVRYSNPKFGLQPFVFYPVNGGFLLGWGDYHREFIGKFTDEELLSFLREQVNVPARGRGKANEAILLPGEEATLSSIELDIQL